MDKPNNWVNIANYSILFDAELARNTLIAADIDCEIVNNVNSFYPSIGSIELYVQRDDIIESKMILNRDFDE